MNQHCITEEHVVHNTLKYWRSTGAMAGVILA